MFFALSQIDLKRETLILEIGAEPCRFFALIFDLRCLRFTAFCLEVAIMYRLLSIVFETLSMPSTGVDPVRRPYERQVQAAGKGKMHGEGFEPTHSPL